MKRRVAWLPGLLLALPAAAQTSRVEPVTMERLGTFANRKITESSGIAVSRRQPGIFWTHNDSGDGPFLYAVDSSGRDRGRFRVADAEARDWEDIALAPCPGTADQDCLYIADTGDNNEQHRRVSVYIVAEPTVPATRPEKTIETQPARRLRIRYPDGPHDVEALAVSPGGELSLISKGHSGIVQRFVISAADAERADSVVAQPAETLAVFKRGKHSREATAAAWSPDGVVLAVRTYTAILFFARTPDGLRQAGPACWIGSWEMQGEALDFLDAQTLILTSEAALGQPGVIDRVRCPPPTGPTGR